jgi:hypothetical protein
MKGKKYTQLLDSQMRVNRRGTLVHFILILVLQLGVGGWLFAQPTVENTSSWFPFTPTSTPAPGVIGMQSWLDAPAGKHGFVRSVEDKLIFENGQPVKFWGTNICSSLPFTDAQRADAFVEFLAKYGVNAIRFHKFSWYGYHPERSTELDPAKFSKLDYFQSRLRKKGIYYGWSHIYGHRVSPGDSARLLAYQEIKNLNFPWSHLNGSTASLVNFAPDLQQLNIDLTVSMLNHVNPYTGLRYADDPALAFVEFQNEDNIFWGAIEMSLQQAPTYKRLLSRQFSQWLKAKYGSQSALEAAWGKGNLKPGETLEEETIFPQPSHQMFSREYQTALSENRPMATHVLDKIRFLYERQLDFYQRFETAVRATGYKGVLVGSCWQAGSGPSHFYNLYSDNAVGMVDRHNYFGAEGHRMQEGKVTNHAMISQPGSGLLSTGLQDVADRPFSFSEWMSKVPNEWTAEAAPLIAFYGMGLQGWDASFSFATDIPAFSRYLESEGHGLYNATSPLHMGLYPALARMVHRGDITESPILSTRNVHVPSLAEGKLGFREVVRQGHDVKDFSGTFSPELLAVGRFPVRFTDSYLPTKAPDVSLHRDEKISVLKSVTGQLQWHYGEKKYVTLNAGGSTGVVGFWPKQTIELGDWEIYTENPFAVLLITSLSSKVENVAEADSILVTAVARGRNTDMTYEYNEGNTRLTSKGKPPLLLEPVKATLKMKGKRKWKVTVLDQDGLASVQTAPVKGNRFEIDGEKYRTIYYLITKN